MLSLEEFQQWNLRQKWNQTTIEVIADIRAAPPTRRVKSRAGNVSGRYPSRKMGLTIQFESHTVELAGIYQMEYEEDVLEYYDRSIGCVGILKDWLTQTYRKALEEDASTLQPRHWESYAPSVAKCLSIAAEAIDGEKAFQFESGELAHALRQKLGLSKVSSSMVSSDNSSPTGTLGQKPNRRPGVRQPNRDVIGGT